MKPGKDLISKAVVALIPDAHRIAALALSEVANRELQRFFAD